MKGRIARGGGRMPPNKWRPRLALVLVVVLGTVLVLPLAGLFFFRIYDNQLIRQTEGELVAQSAALAAVAAQEADGLPEAVLGGPAPAEPPIQPGGYRPILPSLDITTASPMPPRPAALPATAAADPALLAFGDRLMPVLLATQQVTLAGFRLLDAQGTVIAGRDEVGASLAHVEEVAEAVKGRFAGVVRRRISKHAPPPLGSISRGTPVRVFVAMPIVSRGRVAGAIYASRTPADVADGLYAQRRLLGLAAASVFAAAALIGYVLHRTISVPVRDLMALAAALGAGGSADAGTPRLHGTVEFAALSEGFRAMAARLTQRSDAVSTFAAHVSHELKSPLTAIRGAAELLRNDDDGAAPRMDEAQRNGFLDNILADAARLGALLQRLRELAQAEQALPSGGSALRPIIETLRCRSLRLGLEATGDLDATMRLPADDAASVLTHLADNAARHGATRLDVSARLDGALLRIAVLDDGGGIPAGDRDRIFDPFFTTRRDDGGTGMGLPIVRAMLRAHGGTIEAVDAEGGAAFALAVPLAEQPASEGAKAGTARPMLVRLSAVAAVIAAGLALRLFGPGVGLPFEVTKYGGSVLWGMMVYGLVSLAWPGAGARRTAPIAMAVAAAVELSRLVHAPSIDAFRQGAAGALLTGRVFSTWNIAAYAAGILAWAGRDVVTGRHGPTQASGAAAPDAGGGTSGPRVLGRSRT